MKARSWKVPSIAADWKVRAPEKSQMRSWITLFLICVSISQSLAAGDEPGRVVVLGDSLAAGYGLDPTESYPAVLQKKIRAAGWNYSVVNAGVSGDTSAGGLRRLEWLLKRPMDVLVLALGGNDGLRGIPAEAMKANLQGIIDRVKRSYPEAQIVVVGMKMPASMGPYAEQFNAVFPAVASVNHAALVPFLLEGVGGRDELNQQDQIHPTAEGQKIVAENVWKVLRPLLETRNGNTKSAKDH